METSLRTYFIFICLTYPSSTVKILNVLVPDVIKNGTESYAIVDCDYMIDERDKETLEVKWYFRHDPTPIYTWVPPHLPQVSEILNWRWQIFTRLCVLFR